MKRFFNFIFFYFFAIILVQAQNIPVTRVFAFQMNRTNDTTYSFSEPRLLTSFNPKGYNNQPGFISPNLLYLTVQFPDTPYTDIYALDLAKKQKTRVTATLESEYSPTLLPNYYEFSVIRVDADEKKTQRLWKYPIDRTNIGQILFPHITGIGYHNWINDYKAALFVLGENTNHLVIANSLTNSSIQVLDNIGRGFQNLGGNNIAFIHKVNNQVWYLKEMETSTYQTKEIIRTLPNSEDFIYFNGDTFLMGNGSKLYKFNRYLDKEWKEIADFKYYGIKNITRLALSSNNTIAIVDTVK